MNASRMSRRFAVAAMASAIAALGAQAGTASAQFGDPFGGFDPGALIAQQKAQFEQVIKDAQCAADPTLPGCPVIDLGGCAICTPPTGGTATGGTATGGTATGGTATGGTATGGAATGGAPPTGGTTPVVPVVSVDGGRRAEGNSGLTPVSVEFKLSVPTTVAVSVNWATHDGSAIAGSDYLADSGKVTFQPGETKHEVGLSIIGDTIVEADEHFGISLSGVTNATLGGESEGVTIVNDDFPPVAPVVNVTTTTPAVVTPVAQSVPAPKSETFPTSVSSTTNSTTTNTTSTSNTSNAPPHSDPVPLVANATLHAFFEGMASRRTVLINVACPPGPACADTVRLIAAGSLIVGKAPFQLAGGSSAELTVKLSRTAQRILARRHRLRITARPSTGRLGSFTVTLAH